MSRLSNTEVRRLAHVSQDRVDRQRKRRPPARVWRMQLLVTLLLAVFFLWLVFGRMP